MIRMCSIMWASCEVEPQAGARLELLRPGGCCTVLKRGALGEVGAVCSKTKPRPQCESGVQFEPQDPVPVFDVQVTS